MLKKINPILTGDLLKVLCDMGHGDTIVIADGNYSAESDATRRPPIWLTGYGTLEIVGAILEHFPLDTVDGPPAGYIIENTDEELPVSASFIAIVNAHVDGEKVTMAIPRKEFHEEARVSYAIVATNDPTHYACFALRKGALPEPQQVSIG